MKSKRHSRTVTPSNIHPTHNVSPPSISRPTSVYSPTPISIPEKEIKHEWKPSSVPSNTAPKSNDGLERPKLTHKGSRSLGGSPTPSPVPTPKVEPESPSVVAEEPPTGPSTPSESTSTPPQASGTPAPIPIAFPSTSTMTHTNDQLAAPFSEPIAGPSTPISSSQSPTSNVTPLPRKTSSFRHVPRRTPVTNRSPLPSSPLRTAGTFSRNERPSSIIGIPGRRIVSLAEVPEPEREHSLSPTLSPAPVSVQPTPYTPHQRPLSLLASTSQTPAQPPSLQPVISKDLPPSPSITASASFDPTPLTTPILPSSSQPLGSRNSLKPTPAPYRPGFQPKGVYRPHTDVFLVLRSKARDEGRVERTKLERRLEKIVTLHFSGNTASNGASSVTGRGERKRTSSLFSVESLSGLRDLDPSELWKGVLTSQVVVGGAKADIRGKPPISLSLLR